MWLLPVVLRRQELLQAARTPLRSRAKERDARGLATDADCRTAARRSRGNAAREDKKQDKSEDILLAPSIRPRLLRDPSRDGTNGRRAHCELSKPARPPYAQE